MLKSRRIMLDDTEEVERFLTALIKSLENKPWNPWTLFSN